jgi:hypothetical protein
MTPGPVSDLAGMLAGMAPVLDGRKWRFVVVGGETPADAFALIREDEGMTAIVTGAGDGAAFARITLMVHSALEGVGLTAAVSGALADAGTACNVVAGFTTITCLCRGIAALRRWNCSSASRNRADYSPSRCFSQNINWARKA